MLSGHHCNWAVVVIKECQPWQGFGENWKSACDHEHKGPVWSEPNAGWGLGEEGRGQKRRLITTWVAECLHIEAAASIICNYVSHGLILRASTEWGSVAEVRVPGGLAKGRQGVGSHIWACAILFQISLPSRTEWQDWSFKSESIIPLSVFRGAQWIFRSIDFVCLHWLTGKGGSSKWGLLPINPIYPCTRRVVNFPGFVWYGLTFHLFFLA